LLYFITLLIFYVSYILVLLITIIILKYL